MSFKKIIYTLSLIGLIVPFVLITNLFPFVRFGMFAEPVRFDQQQESFIITFNERVIDGEKIGIDPNTFSYLIRNHVYRSEETILLQKLSGITPSSNGEWSIYRQTLKGDTVLLESYHAE